MKIVGVFNPCSTDYEVFLTSVIEDINKLQEDEQEVEVQYSTTSLGGNNVLYSALIIGRKKRSVY